MYSVVLMMALSQSTDLPALGHKGGRGCHGGGGCYGAGYGGCYGGGYGGGCYGGGYGGGYGGCYGGGYGGGYGGCYGGGFGYGGGVISGGCYGGGYGGFGSGVISGGCYGSGFGGSYMAPIQGGTIQGEQLQPPKDGKKSEAPAPATIVVSLPEDATLTIDDSPTTSTSGSRTFFSPELQPGKDYHYSLKATVVRDGKSVVVEKRVTVHAGETTPVTLTLPETGVAQR